MTFAFPATRLSLRIPTGPGTTISCYASAIRPVFAVSHRTGIRSCCATCGYILPLSERLHCFPSVGSPVPLSESVGFLIGVLMAEHNGISFRIPIVCSRKRTLLQWVAPNATAGAINTQSLTGLFSEAVTSLFPRLNVLDVLPVESPALVDLPALVDIP